jgi:hypothetical protein
LLLAGDALALAGFGAVLLAGVVEVAFAACRHADVGAAAVSAAHDAGEQEVRAVATAAGRVLAALGEDRLRLIEGALLDQWLVCGEEVSGPRRVRRRASESCRLREANVPLRC